MEVKINKEIREYSENMFFGLTLRQFFFSVFGCAVAVVIYFLCKETLGLEITTWLCVLGVVPFAAIGFIKYNGLTAEQVAVAYVKSKLLYPRRYLSEPVCFYYDAMEENIAIRQGSLTKKELKKIQRRDKRAAKKAAKEMKQNQNKRRGGRHR